MVYARTDGEDWWVDELVNVCGRRGKLMRGFGGEMRENLWFRTLSLFLI